MQAQVKEWGNSQGIRLSKEVLKSAGIKLKEFLDLYTKEIFLRLKKQNILYWWLAKIFLIQAVK